MEILEAYMEKGPEVVTVLLDVVGTGIFTTTTESQFMRLVFYDNDSSEICPVKISYN